MVRVLVFSTLYPNAAQPNHGVFVENRLRATLEQGELEATVVAPVPYFPAAHPVFGRYAAFAKAPSTEIRHGVKVWHPRYAAIPKVGAAWAPDALFRTTLRLVRRLQRQGQGFDVIDAHYFYPDGVAAAQLGRALRVPVVITGRGTDLTLIPKDAGPRIRIRWAAQEAAATVAVCEDLRKRLVAIGAPASRTLVLRNGVDLERFRPVDKAAARRALQVEGFTLLCVGALIPRKDHELVIRALAQVADVRLLIAGDGPLRAELEALARRLKVADRIRFLGEVAHADLPPIYAAADVMVLASSREGWANVLLESMACGTPVIASDVNGAGEVVQARAAGLLMPERTPDALVDCLRRLRDDMPRREETRAFAEGFGWERIGRANKALLAAAAAAGYQGRHAADILGAARQCLGDHTEQPPRRSVASVG